VRPPELDADLVQRGARLFLDPSVSGDGTRSCATCHPGNGTNGRSYIDGEEVPRGTPGARDVPDLWGLWQTSPYLADASASLSEALDLALSRDMRGAVLPQIDRRALESYLLSIPPFDRRRVQLDGTPEEPVRLSALEGFDVFRRARCVRCHPPPVYARGGLFDIGTGGKYRVPSLRGLSETSPYGHDGRWETVEEGVRAILEARGVELSEPDLGRLLAYLSLL
jgi:cytochrome c peroxidase